MEKKNILIVSRSFYPMNSPRSFRTTELVKEFARQGHDVILLTVKNREFHSLFEQEHGVEIRDLGPLTWKGIDISRGSKAAVLVKRVLRRFLKMLFEYPDIELMFKVKQALKNEKGYDLLISVATPHPVHWGVAWAWRDRDPIAETWVADCGDPYMLATLDSFRKLFYFKYLEKAFCRKSDYITVPIEQAKEGYYPEFRDKIRVIPQGFQFDDVDINRETYSENPVKTFAYAGGLIPGGRDPRELLAYLVKQNKPFKFILYTKHRNLVEPFLQRVNGNIEIRDYIPRKELLRELSRMDFLVNIENSTQLQMPSKLIDYYLAGRPVLSVGSTEINTTVVDQFLDGNYTGKYRFNNVNRYRIENVCKKFLELERTV